jgi:hypothetical protein
MGKECFGLRRGSDSKSGNIVKNGWSPSLKKKSVPAIMVFVV